MLKQFRKGSKGFTLIELLVVIAIIGILSSVVVTSFRSAYARGRDTRRVAEITAITNALQLYYDKNSRYPVNLCALTTDATCALGTGDTVKENYLPKVPVDPITNAQYFYYATQNQITIDTVQAASTNCNTDKCQGYHVGANLEESATANALTSDDDHTGVAPILGASDANSCAGTAVAGRFCYDLVQR